MSLKDKYKEVKKENNDESSHTSHNTMRHLLEEVDRLKSSFLGHNFLTLSLAKCLIDKGVISDDELGKHESKVIENYYKKIESDYNASNNLKCVDRKSRRGDHLTISFYSTIDGKPFPEGTSQWYFVVLGDDKPLFEKKLYNLVAGDSIVIKLKIPDDHFDEKIRGGNAVFNVKVRYVKEKCD